MSQPPSVAFPSPGEIIAGKYRIERILGEKGGMGLVVAATQIDLGKSFAIKLLRPVPPDPSRASPIERFRHEARLVARLTSEHVVRVVDLGELPSGMPFMVMEHLQGTDLDDLVEKNGPLSV